MTKDELKKAELLAEIAKKCYIISVKSKADVFFDYLPHCNVYCIRVCKNGWKVGEYGEDIDFDADISISNLKKSIKKLDKLLEKLGNKDYV